MELTSFVIHTLLALLCEAGFSANRRILQKKFRLDLTTQKGSYPHLFSMYSKGKRGYNLCKLQDRGSVIIKMGNQRGTQEAAFAVCPYSSIPPNAENFISEA